MQKWQTSRWVPSLIDGFLNHGGLFDNSPMENYLADFFQNFDKIERKITLAAMNIETGEYTRWDESIGLENLPRVIRASGSVPFFFSPTEHEGNIYIDGGINWNVNVVDAIERCREVVDDDDHIVLDIAITEWIANDLLEEAPHSVYSLHKRMN